MKFSEQWLREWVDPPVDTSTLGDQLTFMGLEVDEIVSAAPDFVDVVVARIIDIAQHPDADRLRVCTVEFGQDEPVQVVCGAPNARAGLTTALAKVGGRLPDGTKLKKAKLRGVELEALYDVGLAITSTLDLEELGAEVLLRAVSLLDARRGALYLLENGHYRLTSRFGGDAREELALDEIDVDQLRKGDTQGPEGWIPLWAGLASPEQAALVRKTMLDESKFATHVPLPTVARDDPGFSDGYWRGLVWLDQVDFGMAVTAAIHVDDDGFKIPVFHPSAPAGAR